jgi:CheY-like chemotaxis protein/HPt (histidine-containing phosphotransfer) domain-containing protein
MPGMNGIETAKYIKHHTKLAKLPTLIMVTAFGREEIMHEAKQAGLSGFLTKPVSPSLLFDTIAETLGGESWRASSRQRRQQITANQGQSLAGKILVVEDNPINQQLAQELLEGFGLSVELAGNGHQALQRLGEIHFDLVIMDIQMPDMDGFQVTQWIRQDSRFYNLPIIAMTAHAMTGDREKCLAAGMNDHLGKPIDPEALFKTLRKWLTSWPQNNKTMASQATKLAKIEPTLPDHVVGLDLAEARKRVSGNTALLIKLLTKFYDHHRHALKLIEQSLQVADQNTALREVHTIQGVAGNLGAYALEKSARALEAAIKTTNPQDISQPLGHFRENFEPVFDSLKVLAKQYPSPSEQDRQPLTKAPVGLLEVTPLFDQLATLLTQGDTDALMVLHQIQEKWVDRQQHSLVQQIERRIQDYDFEEARGNLATLATALDITLTEDGTHD